MEGPGNVGTRAGHIHHVNLEDQAKVDTQRNWGFAEDAGNAGIGVGHIRQGSSLGRQAQIDTR